jgi:hypothetical protein
MRGTVGSALQDGLALLKDFTLHCSEGPASGNKIDKKENLFFVVTGSRACTQGPIQPVAEAYWNQGKLQRRWVR